MAVLDRGKFQTFLRDRQQRLINKLPPEVSRRVSPLFDKLNKRYGVEPASQQESTASTMGLGAAPASSQQEMTSKILLGN